VQGLQQLSALMEDDSQNSGQVLKIMVRSEMKKY
jgi:hypothetical protein